jgi:arsenite-transporting ATPase
VDPTPDSERLNEMLGLGEVEGGKALFQDLAGSLPGIDEAMSFAEVMKLVETMEFSVIVFDTAPTGHTLRLLSFPSLLDKSLGKFVELKSRFGPLFSQFSSMLNIGGEEQMENKLEKMKKLIEKVGQQFKNPDLTTFICVCIPEFLSLYETERLVQELNQFEIDTQNIIINQVLYPENEHCRLCAARAKMQSKYIEQIYDLYEDFHVLCLPLRTEEVRGVAALQDFSQCLLQPSTPPPAPTRK